MSDIRSELSELQSRAVMEAKVAGAEWLCQEWYQGRSG